MGSRSRLMLSQRAGIDQVTDAADGQADGCARARWRLRDLRGGDRLLALALLVLALVPFAVALVRAFHDGWVPSGDEANIATRSLDVFSRHPPLTGLPSTSAKYGEQIITNHPGPIEFYLLALPLRVLGQTTGPLLTAAAINAGFALIALWVVFRRLGLTVMLWAGVLMLAVIGSAGTSLLTDTLSSNMTMFSLIATVALAWALVDGDLRLLPLATLAASYAAQQHLAAGLIVLPLVVVGVVALAVKYAPPMRRGDADIRKAVLRFSIAAAAIAAACWAPVAYDELTSHPGNLTQIVKFARDNTRATLGAHMAVDQALRAITPPAMLTRTDTTGLFFIDPVGPYRFTFGVLVVLALLALAWTARRARPTLAKLALVALVLLAAGFVNGTNIPDSTEAWRVNLYRWTWAAVFVTWIALGAGGARLIGRAIGERPVVRRTARVAPVVLLVLSLLIATSIVFRNGKDDHNRERPAFALEQRVATAVLARIDHHQPVVVVYDEGYAANISVGPALVFRLVEAGVPVKVSTLLTHVYGSNRRYRRGDRVSAIVISSGTVKLPALPGTLLTRQAFSAERTQLLDDLVAAAGDGNVTLAPGAQATINRENTGVRRTYMRLLIAGLKTKTREVIEQPSFLRLIVRGMIASPVFDKAKARRLLELSKGSYTVGPDEQVEVHLLSPDQVRSARLPDL